MKVMAKIHPPAPVVLMPIMHTTVGVSEIESVVAEASRSAGAACAASARNHDRSSKIISNCLDCE